MNNKCLYIHKCVRLRPYTNILIFILLPGYSFCLQLLNCCIIIVISLLKIIIRLWFPKEYFLIFESKILDKKIFSDKNL